MVKQHDPNCAVTRWGDTKSWCDCHLKSDPSTVKHGGGKQNLLPPNGGGKR